jgi:prepilin-type N-terminal cleavage/methylation domain-containing protein
MTRRAERGFTLIELMVALVVSSLLVGMILAIFARMSSAYRGQQQIAGVQQVLSAARATVELDAKQAGLGLAQGFKLAGDAAGAVRSPVRIIDGGAGPDQISFFYADTTTQAAVTGVGGTWPLTPLITVDTTTGFAVGDTVVLSTADVSGAPPTATGANLTKYTACVPRIAAMSGLNITLSSTSPWGPFVAAGCTTLQTVANASSNPAQTMLYKFIARGYRVDQSTTARAGLGPLQLSQTGGLLGTTADNWTDLAYGFTDLQTALQVYDHDADPSDTADADSDGDREWYSGAYQTTATANLAAAATQVLFPLEVSISLVVRTDRDIEGIATAATPQLTDAASPDNNTLGNHAAVTLPTSGDPVLDGQRVFRYTTFQIDFRNLGVGR